MILRRPVAHGRKRQALGPGFSIDRINPSGLDQHVSFSINKIEEVVFLSFCRGNGMGLQWENRHHTSEQNKAQHQVGKGEQRISW